VAKTSSAPVRCPWCGDDPLYVAYHDYEWGVPCHDDARLFEFLLLEGAQAGLAWITILRKRENYRRAFADFDAETIAHWGEADVVRLLADTGIVRNRRKIEATVTNARHYLAVQEQFGSFDSYLWQFTEGTPRQNHWQSMADVPAETRESRALSKDLVSRGFKFVGPTICYALMQAVGLVNDHLVGCFRHGYQAPPPD
jgi:DNA-3-methyladenine glycosylase I